MYRIDWIDQLKLRAATLPSTGRVASVSPVVWKLGWTSLLTDISAEMVNSMLPLYLVLYLHTSPSAFGAIDGIYNGMAVALLSLAGGIWADRSRRHREVASLGYALSAVCKLGLLISASIGWIGAITAIDRVGKGVRTAPRDALLSLNSDPEMLAGSFAVHRALDAAGSLLGPITAFLVLYLLPNAYDVLWITSFVFALLGVAILQLFVENPGHVVSGQKPGSLRTVFTFVKSKPPFRALIVVAGILGAVTISDAFVYLLLQEKDGAPAGMFPLYYVVTAAVYMLTSVPVGRIADSLGRKPTFLMGYALLAAVYVCLAMGIGTQGFPLFPLLLLGLYYAATEGVLMAVASSLIPGELRTTGLAVLTTSTGIGKMVSSLAFGWLWQSQGTLVATGSFLAALVITLLASVFVFSSVKD